MALADEAMLHNLSHTWTCPNRHLVPNSDDAEHSSRPGISELRHIDCSAL